MEEVGILGVLKILWLTPCGFESRYRYHILRINIMSRSYKKYPVHSFASCKSERWDKVFWHSKFRSKSRQYIHSMSLEDDWDFPLHFRSVSNPWCFNKDGKCWFHSLNWKRKRGMFKEDVPILDDTGEVIFIYTIRDLYQLLGK